MLQPGTVINAQVLQILGNDLVRIAIGGQSIDVLSQVPLQAGQTLQLAVSQTPTAVRLAVVRAGRRRGRPVRDRYRRRRRPASVPTPRRDRTSRPRPSGGRRANNQLTPLERSAVSAAAQTAATQQASLAPLFANLGVAAGLERPAAAGAAGGRASAGAADQPRSRA